MPDREASQPEIASFPLSRGTHARRFWPPPGLLAHWALLFAFWVLLSGLFDPFHLIAGALSAALVASITYTMLLVVPARGRQSLVHLATIPWLRLIPYVMWLLKEVAVANWQVLRIVLDPKLPIDPALVRFRSSLRSDFGLSTLANSITLTPGTITVEVANDEFLVHALVGGEPVVNGISAMQHRIARALPDLEPEQEPEE